MGRFTSPDDPGAAGDVTNPQTLHLYAYALNNPLRFRDPTGHSPECEGPRCEEPLDPSVIDLVIRSITRPFSTGPLNPFIPPAGPPDPNCVAGFTNAGMAIGGIAGGYLGASGGGIGGTNVNPVNENLLFLLRAVDLSSATSKAEEIARAKEHSYENEGGETVRWRFLRLVDVTEAIDQHFAEGAELRSKMTDSEADPTGL